MRFYLASIKYQPEIGRILSGHYPGEKVAEILGVPVKCHACHRKIPKKKEKVSVTLPEYMDWWRKLSKEERNAYIQRLHKNG